MKLFKIGILLPICLIFSAARGMSTTVSDGPRKIGFNRTVKKAYDRASKGMSNNKVATAFVGGMVTSIVVKHLFGDKIKNLFKYAYNKVASFFKKRPLYVFKKREEKELDKINL